jgi:hypothetical protein
MPVKTPQTPKARKAPNLRPHLGRLLGYATRWLVVAAAAAGLGAAAALATVGVAPTMAAALAGPVFCPSGARAAIAFVYDVQVRDWNGRLWQAQTPELRCASPLGLPVKPARADFDTAWYGTFAAGSAGLASVVYLMWLVASGLAVRRLSAAEAGEQGPPPPDLPAEFLAECCELAPDRRAPAAQLYAAYAAWSRAKGHRPPASKALARDWRRLGLRSRRFFGYHVWRGARLKGSA